MIVAALLAAAGCGGGTATRDGGTAGTGGRGGADGAAGRGGTCGDAGNQCPCSPPSGSCNTAPMRCDYGTITCSCQVYPQQTALAGWMCGEATGQGGTTGAGGTGGTLGSGGRGGVGGSGTAGVAGSTGTGGTGGAAGTAGAAGRGGAGGVAGTGGGGGRGGSGGTTGVAGGGGAGTTGTGGAGGAVACTLASGCSSSQYCDFSNNRCTGGFGSCQVRPQGCTLNIDQVCGCDGVVYSNPCMAAAAGTDISDLGGCTPPTGTFPCGPRFCTHGVQYCEGKTGGAATNPGDYACHSLPAACGATPTCACISGSAMCGNCTMSNTGDVTTACLFP